MTDITRSDYDNALNEIFYFEQKIGKQYTRKEAEQLCFFFYDNNGNFVRSTDSYIPCHVFKSDDEYVAWEYRDGMDEYLHYLDFTKTASLGLMGELTECGVISLDSGEFSVNFQAETVASDGAFFENGCKLTVHNGTFEAKTNIAKLFGHKLYYQVSDIRSGTKYIVYAKYKKHEPYFDFVQSAKDERGYIVPKVQMGWRLKEAALFFTNGSYTSDAMLYKQLFNLSECFIGRFEKNGSSFTPPLAYRLVSNINYGETDYTERYYVRFNSDETDFRAYRLRLVFEAIFTHII